jgi:hypothetical protein
MYKETLESLLKAEKLDENTVLYRYTNGHHLKKDDAGNDFIEANPDSYEIVVNHYANGHMTRAGEIGIGLAFAMSKDSIFKDPKRICISVRLGEILRQGGKIYQDPSSGEPNSWFLTMPEGSVRITVEDS